MKMVVSCPVPVGADPKELIGKPIKNDKGCVIGQIEEEKEGYLYGRCEDKSIKFDDPKSASFEIRGGEAL